MKFLMLHDQIFNTKVEYEWSTSLLSSVSREEVVLEKLPFLRRLHEYFGNEKSNHYLARQLLHRSVSKFDKDGGAVNFDHPSAIDFEFLADQLAVLKNKDSINCPTYDFATHKNTRNYKDRSKTYNFGRRYFNFHLERLRHLFDHRIYISTVRMFVLSVD